MPTAQGRARREGEALARIQEAQGIITDALGFTLTRLPDEKTRDPEMRRVLMLEQWAHWLGQIAAALTNAPAQEVMMTVQIPVEPAPIQYQGDGIPPQTQAPIVEPIGDEVTAPASTVMPDFSKPRHSIDDMRMSSRTSTALIDAGFSWHDQIPDSDDDLLAIPGIGPAAVQEIREAQQRLTDDQTD